MSGLCLTSIAGLPGVLDYVHNQYPDKFIMFTEACTGANPWDLQKVLLGSWERGQEYVNDVITNLNHWATGWVDWNLGRFLSIIVKQQTLIGTFFPQLWI